MTDLIYALQTAERVRRDGRFHRENQEDAERLILDHAADLIRVARAAQRVHAAFRESGDCRSYPMVALYAAIAPLEKEQA